MHNDNPNEKASRTQCQRILAALLSGETITSLEAVRNFDTMRLASRIHDIRSSSDELWNDIQKVRVKDNATGKHFDAYYSVSAISDNAELAKDKAYRQTMYRINH